MGSRTWRFTIMLIAALTLGCSNVLAPFADTTTDPAIYYQAQMAINARDYSTAITLMQKLSAGYFSRREVQDTYASAYAGLCNLDLLQVANNLSGASGNLFVVLMQGFEKGTAPIITDCQQAETIIRTIGDSPTQRTNDENVFLVFVEFATIGNIMSYVADTNNDGVPDPAFAQCNLNPLTDALVAQVGASLAEASLSLAQVGGSLGGAGATAVSDICTALKGTGTDYCSKTHTSDWSAADIKLFRGVIAASQGVAAGTPTIGLGTCNNTIINCGC